MALTTKCPKCGQTIKATEDLMGKTIRCPECDEAFSVDEIDIHADETHATPPEAHETLADPATAEEAAEKLEPSLGTVGRFELREVLGRGGFGTVYRALDPVLCREVALKVPRSRSGDGPAARILPEAKAAARLRHPNIVAVFEAVTDGESGYIASEYVRGEPLSAVIRQREEAERKPDYREAAEWVRDLARALHYAHGEGIVHRDVKPHNVMMSLVDEKPDRPQLTDFGLAKQVEADVAATSEGTLLGTPAYMPPEQARGEVSKIGPRSDQYSLGVVLYQLMTGRPPFEGATHKVLLDVIETPPPAPRVVRSAIPEPLEAICLKAMSKDPADRYADCQAMADDLDRFLNDELVHAMRHTIVGRIAHWARKHPAIAGWSTAAALALLLFTGVTITINLGSWSQARAATRQAAEETAAAEAKAQDAEQKLADAAATQARAEEELQGVDALRAESEMSVYARQIDKALRAYQDNDLPLADEHLESTRWDYRHFEYSYARRLATGGDKTLIGHQGPVRCLAYSPDGTLVASGGDDATVRVWDTASGECVQVYRGHTKSVVSVAFSPDGKSIVSVTNTQQGSQGVAPLEAAPAPAPAPAPAAAPLPVAPRADPSAHNDASPPREAESVWPPIRLASFQQPAGPTTEIKVWEARSGAEVAAIQNSRACRAVFHTAGRHVITMDRDGHIRSWTLETGLSSGLDLDACPNDKNADGSIRAPAASLMLAADGQRMLSAVAGSQRSSSVVATLWSLPLKRHVALLTATPPNRCNAAALNSSGTRLALSLVSSEPQIELWTVPSGVESPNLVTDPPEKQPAAQTAVIKCLSRQVSVLTFSPDDKLLACAVAGGGSLVGCERPTPSISIRCAWSGLELWQFKGHEGEITDLAFRADSRQLASAGQEGTVKLWDATTGLESRSLFEKNKGNWGTASCLAFSPDSRFLAVTAASVLPEAAAPVPAMEAAPIPVEPRKKPPAAPPAPAPAPKAALPQREPMIATAGDASTFRFASFAQPAADQPQISGPYLPQAPLDGPLVILDAHSGEKVQTLTGHEGPVYSAAFSLDSRQLASAGHDGKIIVWDWKNGKSLITIEAHEKPVLAVAYSPDGKTIASGSCEILPKPNGAPSADPTQRVSPARGEIKLWDAETGKLLRTIHGHADEILSIAFSPDGKRLASSSVDRSVKLWNTETGDELLQMDGPHGIAIRLAFDPAGGKRIAAAVNDPCLPQQPGEVLVWGAENGALIKRLKGHKGFVTAVAYSSDGKRIVSGANPARAGKPLWAEGVIPRNLKTGVCEPACCEPACVPMTCHPPAEVIVWDVTSGTELLRLGVDRYYVWKPVWETRELTWEVVENGIPAQRTATFKVVKQVPERRIPQLTSVALSPDATLIAAGGNGTVKIWDAWICQPVHTKKWEGSTHGEGTLAPPVQTVAYSPLGDLLAVGGLSGNICDPCNLSIVRVYDARTGREILTVPVRGPEISDLGFSPDGARLACVSGHRAKDGFSGNLELWNIAAGTPAWKLVGEEVAVTRAAFSPDGTLLATGVRDGTLTLWNAANGERVRVIKDLSAPVHSLAFSPDGKLIAAGTGQFDEQSLMVTIPGDVTIWEVATGQSVKTLTSQGGVFIDVDFHPSKPNTLITVHTRSFGPAAQGWCQLWDIETGQAIHSAVCGQSSANNFGFHPAGRLSAAMGRGFDVELWEPDRQKKLLALKGHRDRVLSFAWNPTAEQLATVGADGLVKVWDAATALHRAPDCGCCPELEQVSVGPIKDGAIRYVYKVSKMVSEQQERAVTYSICRPSADGKNVVETCTKTVPCTVYKPVWETRELLVTVDTAVVLKPDGTRITEDRLRSLFDQQQRLIHVAYQDDVLDPACLRHLPPESLVLVLPEPRPLRPEPEPMRCAPATCAPMACEPAPPGSRVAPAAPPSAVPVEAAPRPAPPAPPRPKSEPAVSPKEAPSPVSKEEQDAIDALKQLGVKLEMDAANHAVRLTAGREMTSDAMPHVAKLAHLTELSLTWNDSVKPQDMAVLKPLARLKSLALAGVPVTDDGLAHLAGLAELEHLDLFFTSVTDAGLAHLTGLKSLQSLNLARTKVTDAGIMQLAALKNLKSLNLKDTQVTDQGATALHDALPDCQVQR